jgi:uncharacterized protein YmfQ (DUF2313 family)
MNFQDQILNLTKQLYPTGRAFKMRENGIMYRLHKSLAVSEAKAYSDALSIRYAILPDNDNFTVDDATQWEHRLGLITNGMVSLEDRKLAILRKYNHPGTVPARENYRFLQKQLRDAGFDVYVFENRFSDGMGGYYTQNPLDITGGIGGISTQYGQSQYGNFQYGRKYGNKVVNYLDEKLDAYFDTGDNLKSTFFVCGPYLDFANVDVNRKLEFRQIILRTKPVQTVGFLFINYI